MTGAETEAAGGSEEVVIGLISDTHGLLRNEVYGAFEGVDEILHAGDIGDPAILDELEVIAPVQAVYGNVDGWDVRRRVSERVELERAGQRLVMIHGHQYGSPKVEVLARDFPSASVIVYGHTHQPLIRRQGGALVINPGSAGQRRFRAPVTAARLTVAPNREPRAELMELE